MPEKKPKLVYVSDKDPGYTRIKKGKSFIYLDEKKKALAEEKIVGRINKLIIPPIWKDVWICKQVNGHLQCTGRDAKERKQYIYHPDWSAINQTNKFNRLKAFGMALPKLRKQVELDLKKHEWNRSKVLALIVHLLDDYFLRIGNSYYTDHNESYGITTLRRKHIADSSKNLRLEYKAKSNKIRKINIENKRLAKLVREISELPGYEIFKYKEKAGNWHKVDSADVNDYIHQNADEQFTAKDFRTWGGTKLAIENYEEAKKLVSANTRLKMEPTLVKLVAKKLGNTLSTARTYYIHPKVLKEASNNAIPQKPLKKFDKLPLQNAEKIVLTILEK